MSIVERACNYLQDLEAPFTDAESEELCGLLRSAPLSAIEPFVFHPPFVMCEEKGDHWIEDSKGNPVDRGHILRLLNTLPSHERAIDQRVAGLGAVTPTTISAGAQRAESGDVPAPTFLEACREALAPRGEQSGDVRKSETAKAGVGNQMPRDGSTPSAPSSMGALDVLRELVACKDIKEKIEKRRVPRGNPVEPFRDYTAEALEAEYEKRKGPAWEAARAVLVGAPLSAIAPLTADDAKHIMRRWGTSMEAVTQEDQRAWEKLEAIAGVTFSELWDEKPAPATPDGFDCQKPYACTNPACSCPVIAKGSKVIRPQ